MKPLGLGLLFLSAATVLSLSGCQRPQQQQAVALLEMAQQGEHGLSAEGRVAVTMNRPDQEVQTVAEVQRWPDAMVMRFVDGPIAGQQIVQQGDRFYRVDAQGAVHQAPRWGWEGVPPVRELERRFRLTTGNTVNIAGQMATEVIISPWRSREPSVHLWIDGRTGAILARTREGENGKVLFSVRFLNLTYGTPAGSPPPKLAQLPPPPGGPGGGGAPDGSLISPSGTAPTHGRPSAPAPAATGPGHPEPPEEPPGSPLTGPAASATDQYTSVDQLSRQLGFTITVPSFLPGGFKLLGGMPGPYGRAGVLNYSDGVREFSVSVAKRPLNRPGSPAAQGAGHAVLAHWPRRTVAVAVRGDFFYLVGGQLPAETLQRIAASIP